MNMNLVTGKSRKYRLAAVLLASGLLCTPASVTALAETSEIGPGIGLETADGFNQDYAVSENTAFTKVNGQYVNSEGAIIEGALSRGISVSKYQQDIDWMVLPRVYYQQERGTLSQPMD